MSLGVFESVGLEPLGASGVAVCEPCLDRILDELLASCDRCGGCRAWVSMLSMLFAQLSGNLEAGTVDALLPPRRVVNHDPECNVELRRLLELRVA
jgi:hypothetical protein